MAGCATTEDDYFRDVTSRANVYVAPVPSPIKKIAIMPFKAQTELIGTSVSDLFVTEMLRAGRYELVERSQMAKVLSESELSLAGLSAARAAEVGNMLGAEGVVIGTVDEYATVAQRGHPYPVVGITARLIDCTSGKVMWSSDLAKRAGSKDTTLPEQARSVAHEIVAGLYQHWQVQPVTARKGGRAPPSPAPSSLINRGPEPPPSVIAPAPEVITAAPRSTSSQPLLSPPDFKISDMGLREVVLTWTVPKNRGLEYRIDRALAVKGPFTALATVAAEKREYRDTGAGGKPLQDSTTYYYRIVALSDRFESAPSAVKESMTAPPPEPPANLRVTAPAARVVQLVWQPTASEGVAHYAIERAGPGMQSAFEKIGESEKAEYRDSTATSDGATYAYRVTTVNRVGGQSAACAPVQVATRPPPAPVLAEAKSGELRCVPLAWKATPEEDVVRYDIFRAEQKGEKCKLLTQVQGRNTTAWKDEKLTDGTLYRYQIRAVNAAGVASATAAELLAMTRGAPPVVAGVQVASGLPGEVRLVWQSSPDATVLGYDIQRSEGADGPFGEFSKVNGRATVAFADRGGAPAAAGPGALKEDFTYRYRVRALNDTALPGPWSAPVAAHTKPIPPAPDKVAVDYHSGEIRLAWNPPQQNIANYRIWKKGDKTPLGETVKPECVLRFGDVGKRLTITLTAIEQDGLESAPSVPLELEEPPPPVPQELTATTNGLREVVLHWRKPDDNAKQYRIERAEAADEPFGIAAKVSPGDGEYRDAGLAQVPLGDTKTYFYRLLALAANGRESDPSTVARGLTAPPPEPPPEVKAEPSAPRKLKVTWTVSPGEGVAKYVVERAAAEKPEKFVKLAEIKDTAFEEGGTEKTDLQDSTPYLYRITAVNRVGSIGAPSKPVAVTTQPPPAPPAGVYAEAFASRAVRVTWKPSTAEWVAKYIIERAEAVTPEHFKKLGEVKDTKFEEGGTPQTELRDSTKYLYRVTAVNKLGAVGPASAPTEVTTRPQPAVVANFAAKSGEVRCVPLAWSPSPEPDVVCYDICRRDAPDRAFEKIVSVEGRAKTSYLDGGNDPGNLGDEHNYEYRIRAINGVTAESTDSEIAKAVTRGAPPVVTGVKAKGNRPREMPIVWDASPDEKVIGYEILRLAPGANAFTNLSSVAGREMTAFLDRGGTRKGLGQLQDKTEYRYQIVAFNTAHVRSTPSDPVAAVTKPAPAVPRELTATTGVAKQVQLAWHANPEADIACYVVEAAASAGARFHEITRVTATAAEKVIAAETGLGDGEARCYRIKAVDRDELESGWSEVVAGVSRPLPVAPKDLAAQGQNTQVTLTWASSPSPDIKAYKVWKKTFFGADALATVESNTCTLSAEQVGKGIRVLVSAVDTEKLESARSAPLEIVPPPARVPEKK
jgi:fibronectin type 3 domain-containing protein/TolB-like protein